MWGVAIIAPHKYLEKSLLLKMRILIFMPLILIFCIIFAFFPNKTHANSNVWQIQKTGSKAVVTNCSDCEEDIGVILACNRGNEVAKVTVNRAAALNGEDGFIAPVTFIIAGEKYTRYARTIEFGLIGFTPVFYLEQNDPLLNAFKKGEHAGIFFNGQFNTLSLAGSDKSLSEFQEHCGWNDTSEVNSSISETWPNENGAQWFMNTYKEKGHEVIELRYGIPETDLQAIVIFCHTYPVVNIEALFLINYGQAEKGVHEVVQFKFDDRKLSRQGIIFDENSEFSGVHIPLGRSDLVWNYLAFSKEVIINIEGETPLKISGASHVGAKFLEKCAI